MHLIRLLLLLQVLFLRLVAILLLLISVPHLVLLRLLLLVAHRLLLLLMVLFNPLAVLVHKQEPSALLMAVVTPLLLRLPLHGPAILFHQLLLPPELL